MIKKIYFLSLLAFFNTAQASMLNDIREHFSYEWNKSIDGNNDVYIPLHIWHNRHFYTDKSIKSYNEVPLGIGFGKSYLDEKNNWHGFYAMEFLDSHNEIEPIVGYAYIKNLIGNKNDVRFGAGYTAIITFRKDSNYIPLPGILPIASISYKNFSLNGTYIPGGTGNGNVAFFWSTYSF
jgi:palmitoyl transferase